MVVGNGGAAISAVEAIRSTGSTDQITLISDERSPACCPVLTTYFLSGILGYESMFYRDWDFYHRNRVRLMLGESARGIDARNRRVELDGGVPVDYDNLLIATGSTTILPKVPGVDSPGVLTLWNARDALAIQDAARAAETVTIVGAGFIGLQLADAMARRGKRIAVIEIADRVLPQVMDHRAAEILQGHMRAAGIELHLGERVVRIEQEAGRLTTWLRSRSLVDSDLILMATGVKPNIGWLEGSGLSCSTGLIVDGQCRTNVEGVYGAGDVAESVDPLERRSMVNATWINAIEQGRAAGFAMVGKPTLRLAGAQFNAFTLFGVPCASAGESAADPGESDIVTSVGPTYRKLLFRNGALTGALLVGEVDEIGILASAIRRPRAYEAEYLELSSFSALARAFATGLGGLGTRRE